jgi:hypothetical protein
MSDLPPPPERLPLAWAQTQNNLSNALKVLGAREGNTTRLEEAVKAYRAALEERTPERVPLDWARTQNNLGLALKALAGARRQSRPPREGGQGLPRAVLEARADIS